MRDLIRTHTLPNDFKNNIIKEEKINSEESPRAALTDTRFVEHSMLDLHDRRYRENIK